MVAFLLLPIYITSNVYEGFTFVAGLCVLLYELIGILALKPNGDSGSDSDYENYS